jgi:hypothetical protein
MSQVEKKSGHLALLRLGKRNQSLLNFFNAHGKGYSAMTPKQGVTLLPNGSCEPPIARGSSKAPAIAFQNFFVDELKVVYPL